MRYPSRLLLGAPALLAGLLLSTTALSNDDCTEASADQRVPLYVGEVDKEDVVDLSSKLLSANLVADGLFPEDKETPDQRQQRERCERLLAACFKCMPPARSYTRFTLPALKFAFGSAVLPDDAKQALRVVADGLKGRSSGGAVVRIEGHADASGDADGNRMLSERRAASVRDFLVSMGVSQSLFAVKSVTMGLNVVKVPV